MIGTGRAVPSAPPRYSAAGRGMKAGTAARAAASIGRGHQRSSHSAKRSLSCGITFSAKSRVFNCVSAFDMLPN